MQMFEQNMLQNNIKQELINDAMDGVFEDDAEEETSVYFDFYDHLRSIFLLFSDQLVDQVLSELNINIGPQIPGSFRFYSMKRKKKRFFF